MKTLFRRLLVLVVAILQTCFGLAQSVGINDNAASPHSSSMLDVSSNSKGLLIPRIALTSAASASPVTSPETSLVVYNTATAGTAPDNVTPGYYYWTGSRWTRMVGSSDPTRVSGLVSKSASATLLKTENMVLASGNTKLTLPTVTSLDDGLEITVKNVGTYTDLITVSPQSGKKIDGTDSSTLTRWRGKTYVASNSNWVVREKEYRNDNSLDVSADGSFTTIAEAIAFLGMHMRAPTIIHIGGGTYPVSSTLTINLSYPLTIEGLSYGESIITAPSNGNTAFELKSECYLKKIAFNQGTTAGICINASASTAQYHEIKDCSFAGFTKAINVTDASEFWIFETDFDDCTTSGIDIAAGSNDVTIKISECDFTNCAKGIHLYSYGTGTEFSIANCNFYNSTGQTGIYYVPSSTSPYYASMIIQGNSFNNVGTFGSGFDFANSRDANIFYENNPGVPSGRPHCSIHLANNTTTTTVGSSSNWYRANFTNTSSIGTKWTIGNNRVTYQSDNARDAVILISGNIRCNNSNKTVNIAIVKNTATSPQSAASLTRYGETSVRITAGSQSFQFSTNVYLEDVAKNDYFEIWVTSSSSGDELTIDDLNWWTDTH
ncbi:MAG TPA: hypothetical protein PKG48_08240 [Bacteroidales bacterium]|nr:hypothetical protein [Bacteroidales bacterium]